MTNTPPVVSLAVPVLGWYEVQFGGIQMSQMLGLPSTSYLSSPDGVNPGLVGVADGAMLHLNGYTVTGDSGSFWLIWDATSTALPDKITVWNPYPSNNTPGRWLAQLPEPLPISRIVTTGTVVSLAPATEFVAVRKTVPSAVTLQLPNMANAILGQGITVKVDQNAAQYPVTVVTLDGSVIDPPLGGTSDIISQPLASRTYTPDGSVWNKT
jgi:hypothetical protein